GEHGVTWNASRTQEVHYSNSELVHFFFFSSRRRHTRWPRDWSQTCALPIYQIFYVGTVQEEGSIEMRGAATSARIINPDVGFSLEVGIPNDVPGPGPEAAQEVLGGGPGMMLYTFSEIPNRKLVAYVKRVAADQHIPLQFDFVRGFGDDAGA